MAIAAGNTTRLWTLVVREFWRRTRRRLRAGPIYRWRYSGRTPERVLIAPPDLRLADMHALQTHRDDVNPMKLAELCAMVAVANRVVDEHVRMNEVCACVCM